MQQIADWLNELGMSEYAERFAENDIDMAVLPDVTDQQLKDLGVSLGHRLKMLRAIRDLGGVSVAVLALGRKMAVRGLCGRLPMVLTGYDLPDTPRLSVYGGPVNEHASRLFPKTRSKGRKKNWKKAKEAKGVTATNRPNQ